NDLGEMCQLLFVLRAESRALRLDRGGRPTPAAPGRPQVHPEDYAEHDDHQPAKPTAHGQACAPAERAPAALPPQIFDVGACFASFPLHGAAPWGSDENVDRSGDCIPAGGGYSIGEGCKMRANTPSAFDRVFPAAHEARLHAE